MTEYVDDLGRSESMDEIGTDRRAFVGSLVDDDDSVTITILGWGGVETARRVREHLDIAIGRGARFVTVELTEPLDVAPDLCDLLGRTQTRLTERYGLLIVRGLRLPELSAQPQPTDEICSGIRPRPGAGWSTPSSHPSD